MAVQLTCPSSISSAKISFPSASFSFFLTWSMTSFSTFEFSLLFLYFCGKILVHADHFRDIRNFFRNSVQTNRNDLGSNWTCERDIVCLSNCQHHDGIILVSPFLPQARRPSAKQVTLQTFLNNVFRSDCRISRESSLTDDYLRMDIQSGKNIVEQENLSR
jgi:hypothetical protein